jgi:hypothetical protein
MFALRAPLVAFVYCVARLCAICPSRARVQYLGCAFVPMFASRVCVLHCAFVPMFALRVPIVAFVYCVAFVHCVARSCACVLDFVVCTACVARSCAMFASRARVQYFRCAFVPKFASRVCVSRCAFVPRRRRRCCRRRLLYRWKRRSLRFSLHCFHTDHSHSSHFLSSRQGSRHFLRSRQGSRHRVQ